MKKLNVAMALAVSVLCGSAVDAQDSRNPWSVTVGFHGVDHTSARGVFDGFFDYDDYSIVPPISKISVAHHLSNRFAADLTASVGEVDNNRMGINDKLFINAGLGLRYRLLGTADEASWFDPYLRVGASYHKYDYEGLEIDEDNPYEVLAGTGNAGFDDKDYITGDFIGKENYFMAQAGLGINFWFTDNVGLNLASDYNMAPTEESDYVNFFQHSAGLTFKFGKQDMDNDGVVDDEDECPETPGLEEFNGCPDTDGDGIRDLDDACPMISGVMEFNGCADTDGDGIADPQDECPNEVGPVENNGCPWPDTDNDGLTDNLDECPNQAGPQENNGCPWPDSDNDGFTDNVDRCPYDLGVAPDGCPEAAVMVADINVGFVVEFDYNKATIRDTSMGQIANKASEIKKALDTYPNMTLYIDGHTDSKGSASYNKNLSQRRAASVVDALEAAGVPEGALTPRGLGEEVPKCTNETDEGRQCNRRVEVTIKSTEGESL